MTRLIWILVIALSIGSVGCAPLGFTARYKVSGSNDPYPDAFHSAIVEAYFRRMTGHGIYARLGETGQHMGGRELCTEAGAARFVSGQRPSCFFIFHARNEICTGLDRCVRYRLSPVLRTAEMREFLEQALGSPCDSLSRIEESAYPGYPYANIQPLAESRDTLACDSDSPIAGFDVRFEEDGEHIRFFRTGRRVQ